ncbi:MAG TPA: hypothetical protein VFG76_01445, partial [Candidatus Polarisedimenticolia bacterium]|nr:hypothetical protein [Candidatus Polarisedimenticolia bacterium]
PGLPPDAVALTLAARLALGAGDLAAAKTFVELALRTDPGGAEAAILRERIDRLGRDDKDRHRHLSTGRR